MHYLSHTKSRCLTNPPTRFGARRTISTVNFSTRQIVSNFCPTVCCRNAVYIDSTRFIKLHAGRLDDLSWNLRWDNVILGIFFVLWRCDPTRVMASSFLMFLDHTQRRTTVGRTPLDEWSARRRDLYLTTHSTHNRQTSMPPVGFEPTISAGERPQIYALDRAAIGTGILGI